MAKSTGGHEARGIVPEDADKTAGVAETADRAVARHHPQARGRESMRGKRIRAGTEEGADSRASVTTLVICEERMFVSANCRTRTKCPSHGRIWYTG